MQKDKLISLWVRFREVGYLTSAILYCLWNICSQFMRIRNLTTCFSVITLHEYNTSLKSSYSSKFVLIVRKHVIVHIDKILKEVNNIRIWVKNVLVLALHKNGNIPIT